MDTHIDHNRRFSDKRYGSDRRSDRYEADLYRIFSFVGALIFSLSENRKTHNHPKSILMLVCLLISLLSILGAYVLDLSTYRNAEFVKAFQNNLLAAIDNIQDFGFLIVLAAVGFGLIVGSDKSIRKTYSYKSSKHTETSGKRKKQFRKK